MMQQNSRRSQSKNLMDLKNNLINQKNLLPSKSILSAANQSGSNDYSPKNSSMFKRNLSLPFKQCKNHQQVYRRVRNESVHEAVHHGKVQSPPTKSQKISPLTNSFKGDSLIDCDFSYNNKSVYQYQKNSTIKHNESGDDIKRAHETSQV